LDCRLPIHGIADCRLPIADCRLPIADWRPVNIDIENMSGGFRQP
jgi:hypothetical protein